MHFHFRYLKRLRVYPLHDRNRKPDMMWNGKGNLSRIARNSKINIKHIFFLQQISLVAPHSGCFNTTDPQF